MCPAFNLMFSDVVKMLLPSHSNCSVIQINIAGRKLSYGTDFSDKENTKIFEEN